MNMKTSLVAFLLAAFVVQNARAQDATVFFPHVEKVGEKKPSVQLRYQLPGEDEKAIHRGIPAVIQVPQGNAACYQIERANPLLYVYSIGSKIVKVETPDTASQVLKQILALAPKPAIPGMGLLADDKPIDGDPVAGYAATVGQLFRIRTEMEALKLSSDTATNLVALARHGMRLASAAADTAAAADKKYSALSDASKKDLTARMLRAAQLDQSEKSKRLLDEFTSVSALVDQPLCSAPLSKDRLHLSLSIAGKSGIPSENLRRITGDEVAAFDAEPLSNQELEFGGGMILAKPDHRAKTFALAENKITEGKGDELLFRPALFVNLRSWGPRWLWASIGLSGDKDGIGDLFAGITGRFGHQVAGARLAAGVGLTATKLVTGLSKGSVGQPLPSDINSLDKILKKELVPGFGIMLMATGF
jgi:hypothetical protein